MYKYGFDFGFSKEMAINNVLAFNCINFLAEKKKIKKNTFFVSLYTEKINYD
jgi:hypothetical protein